MGLKKERILSLSFSLTLIIRFICEIKKRLIQKIMKETNVPILILQELYVKILGKYILFKFDCKNAGVYF